MYPGHDWESGAVRSWIVGVKLGKALICGGNVGMARVKVWAVNCQVRDRVKMFHCCSDSSKHNVPVVTLARPRMAAALKHDLILFKIPEDKEI